MRTLLFFIAISLVPKAALACGDDSTRPPSKLTSSDAAGEFTIEFEPDRIVSVTIDGNPVDDERLAREDGRCSVTDEHGSVVLEIEVSKDGGVRWKSRRSRVVVGLTMGDVDEALAAHLGVEPSAAVLITDVVPDGPAERAGLARFDVVVAVDGRRPATRESLQDAVAAKSAGETLTLAVRRGAERKSVAIVAESPGAALRLASVPHLSSIPLLRNYFGASLPTEASYLLSVTNEASPFSLMTRFDPARDWTWKVAAAAPPTVEDRLATIDQKLARLEALIQQLVSEHTPR